MQGGCFALAVCFAIFPDNEGHYSGDKYDLTDYNGLFFSNDEIKGLKEDMGSLLLATIKDKDRSFRFTPGKWKRRLPKSRKEKVEEECPERSKRRTCPSCCQTQWVADRVWKVMYNNTEYNVVQKHNKYQVIFQGVCSCSNCGPVITCGEEDLFFTPILVEDSERPKNDSRPATHFLPLRISRFCQCSKGSWIV
ncbi:uncharacterized protein LOC110445556 [Mizuhopecten yessoensis]|uniref:Uncharacterized protein n=1 Tax=Mizuhopecten yessoensis TaxID=6573 RepID=A0A210QZC9_MIZYE|nr:uncharacterized protein LOC110445556 [Mizuhopecten yessoensis]XP_021345897.1 uncharacterized protein LOC110445556 [Mizuhopecten yessoensis]OWF54128.1 hypothetical protein KP79_PYT15189 [Mizuhopecten yessoensis]